MKSPVVIDTNVVVAGLLTFDAESPVVSILNDMLAAVFPFVVSEALLAEYRTVLVRPRLRDLHGLSANDIDSLLTELALHAIVLDPIPAVALRAPDPGDQLLWDLLALRADLLLVTGDRRLLADPAMEGRILSPRAFVGGE